MSLFPRASLLAVAALFLTAGTASAATTTPQVLPTVERAVALADAQKRNCLTEAAGAAGVAMHTWNAPDDGFVAVRLRGPSTSDWDVTLFDAATGRKLTASNAFGSNELATTKVSRGQALRIQTCRRSGAATRVPMDIDFTALLVEPAEHPAKLVEIQAQGQHQLRRIRELGIDTTDHTDGTGQEAILHGPDDERTLTEAGFTWTVKIPDLAAQFAKDRASERAFRLSGKRAGVPSGRTSYRDYEDYLADMKKLVDENPGLVRPFTLPLKTIEGRDMVGIEIASDVNRTDDGRPVFFQIGVHHAREWPAGEATMEFGIDLVQRAKAGEARWKNIVDNARTMVVPIMNVDGFITTRTVGSLPQDDLPTTPGTPQQIVGGVAYRRKNCRPLAPVENNVPCQARQQNDNGVDPNRNYGEQWGGPGTSSQQNSLLYHGTGPFSEPETQSVRQWLLGLHPTVLITNHTFSGLILRPPGTSFDGPAPDEDRMRQLGDAMARETNYISQYSYQLYDTSGTTDDWLYGGLGSFSYTPEIGKQNFHPSYTSNFVPEYDGREEMDKNSGLPTGRKLGGLREAYLLAGETAINPDSHSILEGTAAAGRTLRLQRDFVTVTSSRPNDNGVQHPVQRLPEHRESTLQVGQDGRFTWHVAPSTRPFEDNPVPWKMTCEDRDGNVLESGDVYVERDQTLRLDLCGAPARDASGRVIGICGDTFRPQSSFAKASRVSRRRIALRGGSVDRGCRDPETGRIRAEGVGRVEVAIQRFAKVGSRSRCQSLLGNGRLGRARGCTKPMTWLRATGTRNWTFRKNVRLPRGQYKIWVRGTDRAGNQERRDARRNFLRKRVR